MSPQEALKHQVANLLKQTIARCGLNYNVRTEFPSPHGSTIRGQGRHVDVAVLDGERPLLFIECKWQGTSGTAQDKLFRAQEEAVRDRLFGVHSIVVLGGDGWSREIERWAIGEGMLRIEWFENWTERFFCSRR